MNSRNVNQHHHHRGKLGKLSFESAKLATTSGIDDLLSSTEGGKHDYDWLLTPPGTPHLPSSEDESQPTLLPPRSRFARPMPNTKASTLSVSESENKNESHSRPSRSSSVSRSPNRSSSNSILNTRPSSPITRSPSAARPSTPTPPRVLLLPRSFPSPTNSDIIKTRTTQGSRPSIPATPRSPSRPSTPTRRHSPPSPLPSATRLVRNPVTPRPQPVVPPDFPLDTPPNLRTTLPADRPVSAGRSRPGRSLKQNSEMQAPVSMSRRQPSPIANRGILSEYTGKGRGHSHTNAVDASEVVSNARRSVKSSTTAASENNGLGRTMSKKSLDMAIRHMDVRSSSGTLRSVSSATLYPQSIRSSTPKTLQTRGLSVPAPMNTNGRPQSWNTRKTGREIGERQKQYLGKLSQVVNVNESYRYDSLLLKEDLNNTNWLRSVDDKCDQGPIFDNGFESLPEPFGLF